jgi:VCBS repeat-containing protein
MMQYNSRVRLFLLVTVISLCLSFTANAQKSWKLDVSGNVRDEDSKAAMKGAKLEITKGGAVYKTIYADDNGNFSYSLDPDNTYTVKVSYGNYVSKIITISTENTPSDEEVKQNFKANTEFRIFKRVEDIDY